jgi:tRNA pseudouridine55 synthase
VTDGAPAAAPAGICVVDKPAGWTSHDVVARCRRLLGTRKVGHSGTLDPMATGVLVLGVGPATRLLTFLSGVDKDYEATIRFGVETDSLDADGEVVATHDTPVRADAVLAAAADLLGESDQVPPMVSAVKIDGVRLHERARAGEEVERPSRRMRVDRFDPTPTDDPLVWRAAVSCSSGTYVRVLAADLGHAIGSGAHLTALRRTRVGPFTLDEAVPLDDVDPARLLAPSVLARLLPTVEVDESTAVDVGHGKVLERARLLSAAGAGADAGDGPWVVLGPSGDLLAVYQPHRGDRVKPAMVLGRN